MRISPSRLLTGPLLITSMLILAACEQEQPVEDIPLRSVRHVTVTDAEESRVRSFSGVSRATRQASLSFKVAGNISELAVAVGDRLEKGQVIATLDPSGFRLQLQQAEADLLRAEAEQRNAAAAYERIKGLYENQSASRTDLDTARAASESASALVNAASRSVELARLNLSYTTLKAQQACSIAQTSADAGENVAAGQEVVQVNCGDQLEIALSVPETLIAGISPGMLGSILFDSQPGETFEGVVVEVGIAATGATFPVTVAVDGSNGLRSGLAAQVNFAFNQEESSPLLPPASVAEDEQGRFVYKLVQSEEVGVGLIQRQTVEIGELTSNGLEILAGIAPGDRIVTAGVSVVQDGMKVRDD